MEWSYRRGRNKDQGGLVDETGVEGGTSKVYFIKTGIVSISGGTLTLPVVPTVIEVGYL